MSLSNFILLKSFFFGLNFSLLVIETRHILFDSVKFTEQNNINMLKGYLIFLNALGLF